MNPWDKWSKSFPGCPPIGHLLRDAACDRWIRLYTLPDGQRTPADQSEFNEVIYRYNIVASVILGIGADTVAWLTHYGSEGDPPSGSWREAPQPPDWTLCEALTEDLEGATFLYATLQWRPGIMDAAFRLMATGHLGPFALISSATSSAFCPYEGGIDVFLRNSALIEPATTLFPGWLSPLPSGL